jgi:TonB family protein
MNMGRRSHLLVLGCLTVLAAGAGWGVWRSVARPQAPVVSRSAGIAIHQTSDPTSAEEGEPQLPATSVRTPPTTDLSRGPRTEIVHQPRRLSRTPELSRAARGRSAQDGQRPADSGSGSTEPESAQAGASQSIPHQQSVSGAGRATLTGGAGAGVSGSTAGSGSGAVAPDDTSAAAPAAVGAPRAPGENGTSRPPRLIPPKVITFAGTDYPLEAFRLVVRRQDLGSGLAVEGAEGTVGVRALVHANGTVARADAAVSSGSAVLDRAATEAVRRWLFAPATRDDVPIDAYVTLTIRYVVR